MIVYTVIESDDLSWLINKVNEVCSTDDDYGFTPWEPSGPMLPVVNSSGTTTYHQTLTRSETGSQRVKRIDGILTKKEE